MRASESAGERSILSPQHVKLTISTKNDKSDFKKGEPINLEIRVENISDENIYLPERCPEMDYKLNVKNSKGSLSR